MTGGKGAVRGGFLKNMLMMPLARALSGMGNEQDQETAAPRNRPECARARVRKAKPDHPWRQLYQTMKPWPAALPIAPPVPGEPDA